MCTFKNMILVKNWVSKIRIFLRCDLLIQNNIDNIFVLDFIPLKNQFNKKKRNYQLLSHSPMQKYLRTPDASYKIAEGTPQIMGPNVLEFIIYNL